MSSLFFSLFLSSSDYDFSRQTAEVISRDIVKKKSYDFVDES